MDIKNIANRLARGKTKDGQWVKGYYVGNSKCGDAYIIPPSEVVYDCGYIDTSLAYECIPETVGWYTGIDSSEHEEVYEGDYVEYITRGDYGGDGEDPKRGKAIIGYDTVGFTMKSIDGQILDSFMLFMFYEDWHCNERDPDFRIIKVLGNRWDNPEIQVIPPNYEVKAANLPF